MFGNFKNKNRNLYCRKSFGNFSKSDDLFFY